MGFTEGARLAPPPTQTVHEKPPRPQDWENRLRELPREWKLMVEDFGLTKSTVSRFADQASRGDEKAMARLEPLKQFYFEIMGMTLHERVVRHEDGELAGKPVIDIINGEEHIRKETRSVWGIRDGYDLTVDAKARKPKPGMIKAKIDRHFYSFVTLLEFVKKGVPLKFHGQGHPNMEGFKEAHSALTKGGTLEPEFFNDKKRLSESIDKVIAATADPARYDTLTMLKPFLVDGKKTTWNGLD